MWFAHTVPMFRLPFGHNLASWVCVHDFCLQVTGTYVGHSVNGLETDRTSMGGELFILSIVPTLNFFVVRV